MSQRLASWGVFAFDEARPQAGLRILDTHDAPLFTSPYPARTYQRFEDIPPLVVQTLLFIENRVILDSATPYRNPSVEWDRLAGALFDVGLNKLYPAHRISGGSTLATQIEKIRYSPGGRTDSSGEKLRQMLSASLRAYRDGEDTMQARQRIVRDYLNSLPLAATAGHGEVHGLGDGLWAWYGVDFHAINNVLSEQDLRLDAVSDREALAYRQVLSLLLAVNSPAHYLIKDSAALDARTDSYLHLLAKAGVIPESLAGRASSVRVVLRREAPPTPPIAFADRKGADAVRAHLVSLLGLEGTYALDRLDLTAGTTLDLASQKSAAGMLRQFADPEFAARNGLVGSRMLGLENLGSVVYSFTLYERTPGANLLRVQTDNYGGPLNINEGTKLELGSTAKLRTLTHYLEIVAALHQSLAGLTQTELETAGSQARDPLTRWAADYLATAQSRNLPAMLAAAMRRSYTANPAEGFFTGGGMHYFSNFNKDDNGRVLTVSDAFEQSVNLVFVRLMRDLVRYHEARMPDAAGVLEDPNNPARRQYLTRFAEFEGGQFLRRFYAKYRGLRAADLTSALVEKRGRRGVHPLEVWLLNYMISHPGAGWSEILDASLKARRDAYDWLYMSRHAAGQNTRIQIILERDAFSEIHRAWARLGFPFASLVPSYATALGSSGDNPAALAELAGIILNDGVRQPDVRIERLRFAEGTPWESILERKPPPPERVLLPEIAAALRGEMIKVVENGTARRAFRSVVLSDGTVLPVGGKTGTGDNRIKITLAGGRRLDPQVRNRTATFVFIIGDRFFGVMTAFVPGQAAGDYSFTSALPVQAFKTLAQSLQRLIDQEHRGTPPASAVTASLRAAR